MLEKIAQEIETNLKNADAGLCCNWKPGYTAYASELENGEGWMLQYTKDGQPYVENVFETPQKCVAEMVKISVDWIETEVEE